MAIAQATIRAVVLSQRQSEQQDILAEHTRFEIYERKD